MTEPVGHGHGRAASHGARTLGGSTADRNIVVFGLGLLFCALMIAVLPDLAPAQTGLISDRAHGRVTALLTTGDQVAPQASVLLLDGNHKGETINALLESPTSQTQIPKYQPGDEVLVAIDLQPDGTITYSVIDRWRAPILLTIVGALALMTIAIAGWRGLRALTSLAITVVVVVRLLIPLLLSGYSPVGLAIGLGILITILSLLLTQGISAAHVRGHRRHGRGPGRDGDPGRRRVIGRPVHGRPRLRGGRDHRPDRRQYDRPLGSPARRGHLRRPWRAQRRGDHPGGHDRRVPVDRPDDVPARALPTGDVRGDGAPGRDRATRSCSPISAPPCRSSCCSPSRSTASISRSTTSTSRSRSYGRSSARSECCRPCRSRRRSPRGGRGRPGGRERCRGGSWPCHSPSTRRRPRSRPRSPRSRGVARGSGGSCRSASRKSRRARRAEADRGRRDSGRGGRNGDPGGHSRCRG